MRDPYQVLGVGRSASADEVKSAYRRLAKRLHPDVNPGRSDIEQRFKEVSAAYTLLSDAGKRARFDRGEIDANGNERVVRRRSTRRTSTGRSFGEDPFASGFSADDIFADFFGSGRRRAEAGAGTAGTAGGAGGGNGSGAAGGAGGNAWGATGAAGAGPGAGAGTGGVRARGPDISYSVTVSFLDSALGAKRRVSLSNGKSIDVSIPPGTEDQQKLRLKAQGMAGLGGGEAGDAIVEVHVESHPFFTRTDYDIHLELPITLPEAVLGDSVKVPTLNGVVALKVPAGSNTGTVLRMRGKGIVNPKTATPGDQYVKLKVVLPDPPDRELVEFVQKWSKDRKYDVRRKVGLE